MIDVQKIKKDFPILNKPVDGKRLVYLDNAATTQKPKQVIDALVNYYENMNANVHRGLHSLSERATSAYENSRQKVADFINAKEAGEIIFTKGATESINLLAYSWGEDNIIEGDEIIVSIFEHHSNFVPWQELCKRKKAHLVVIGMDEDGNFNMEQYRKTLNMRTRLVAVTQMSNALGTILPVKEIIQLARKTKAKVMIDGAQSVPHMKVDVQDIDADFLTFSAHKMLGPTGVGVLWGKHKLLEDMRPFQYGGEMIKEVTLNSARWNDVPYKFEAGTPNIADVAAFSAAIEYLDRIGMKEITEHCSNLATYAYDKLRGLKLMNILSPEKNNGGIMSFKIAAVHAHDIGSILNEGGVAIRAGHHCAQPLMDSLKVPASARMSFYIYNDEKDIDAAVENLKKVYEIFKV